jgi:hypothetical protein
MPGYQNVVVKLILPAELMTALAYLAAGADPATVSAALLAAETGTANLGGLNLPAIAFLNRGLRNSHRDTH